MINQNLIVNQEERRQIALECQQNLREFLQTPNESGNNEERKKINRLKNHAYVWWAQLSIEITRQDFNDSWHYLERIKTPPYSKVAKLWQAHLIIRNGYSPTENHALDIQWARRIMNSLTIQRAPAIPQNEQINNLVAEVVEMVENGNLVVLPIPPEQQEINIPDLVENEIVPEPEILIQQINNNNIQDNQNEIHPLFLNSQVMKEMRNQLLVELANQEQELALLNNPPQTPPSEDDDRNTDNDSENSAAEEDIAENEQDGSSTEEEPDNNDTEDDDDNDDNNDGFDNPNNFINFNIQQRFNNFFPEANHDEIDRLTLEYLQTQIVSHSLKAFLSNKYESIKQKKDTLIDDNRLDFIRLVYHYSLKMPYAVKSKKINDEIYQLFRDASNTKLPNIAKNLAKLYNIININNINQDNFFRQVLAYRKELKNASLTKLLFLETYNSSKSLFRSGGDFSFIDEEISDINQEERKKVIDEFKSGGLNFNNFGRNKSALRSKKLAILWHELEDDDLPKKELGTIKKAAGIKSFNDEERNFLTNSFKEIKSKKLDKEDIFKIQNLFDKQFKKTILFRTIESAFQTFKSTGKITVYHNFSMEEKNYIKKHLQKRFENNFTNCKEGFYDKFRKKFNRDNVCDTSLYSLTKECTDELSLEKPCKKNQSKKITDQQIAFIRAHLQEMFNKGAKTCGKSFKSDFEEKFGKIVSGHCYNQAIKKVKDELISKKNTSGKKRALPQPKDKKHPRKISKKA